MPTAKPSITGFACISRRRIVSAVKTVSNCRRMAARSCSTCCSNVCASWARAGAGRRILGARVPQRAIDLTQAEAIADLIESGSRAASRAAMRSLEGRFSEQVRASSTKLSNCVLISRRRWISPRRKSISSTMAGYSSGSNPARRAVQATLDQAEQGRTCCRKASEIALAGLPNAGKSSLLNALAGYEAAIVTDIAGTTRDVLREHLSLRGIPIRINDTAGLRDSDNPVEQRRHPTGLGCRSIRPTSCCIWLTRVRGLARRIVTFGTG